MLDGHHPSKRHINYFDIFEHFALLILVLYVSDFDSNHVKEKIRLIKMVFLTSAFGQGERKKIAFCSQQTVIFIKTRSIRLLFKNFFPQLPLST